MLEQGEWVIEVDRPRRPARRNGAKSDELDALRAAREVLGRTHLAQPRQPGQDWYRVCDPGTVEISEFRLEG